MEIPNFRPAECCLNCEHVDDELGENIGWIIPECKCTIVDMIFPATWVCDMFLMVGEDEEDD